MLFGYAPYVPHLSWFLPTLDASFEHFSHTAWMQVCLPWVAASDALLRFPGDSVGGDLEVAHAGKLQIPVFYSLEALLAGVPSCCPELSGAQHGHAYTTGDAPGP